MPAEIILERFFNKRSFQKENIYLARFLNVGTDQRAGQVVVAAAGCQGLSDDLLHRVQLPRPGTERGLAASGTFACVERSTRLRGVSWYNEDLLY